MKKIASLIVAASLAVAGIGSAQADWGHHRPDFRPPMPHHHHHHDRGGPSWVGPAAVLGIAGLVLGATAYSRAQAAPVYVEPVRPLPPPPAPELWYYCGSSGQYYPYTNVCPEGWVAVQAR